MVNYEVDHILDHREWPHLNSFTFLIRWKGFDSSADTWEPLDNLAGSRELLNDYFISKGIGVSHIDFGDDDDDDNDEVDDDETTSNFADPSQILKKVSLYRSQLKTYCSKDIVVEVFNNEIEPGKIYLMIFQAHFYVLFQQKSGGPVYISDGANQAYKDKRYLKAIRFHINLSPSISLSPILYEGQLGSDHCGSSAVLIILEIGRSISLESWPTRCIFGNRTLRKRLVREFHPRPAEHKEWVSVEARQFPKCSKCGKEFRRGGRRALAPHERSCKGTDGA